MESALLGSLGSPALYSTLSLDIPRHPFGARHPCQRHRILACAGVGYLAWDSFKESADLLTAAANQRRDIPSVVASLASTATG